MNQQQAYKKLGEYAKSIRMMKGYTRDDVVRITNKKISKSWLQKFENHKHLQDLKNYNFDLVETYLSFLGIDNPFNITVTIDSEKFIKRHKELSKEQELEFIK